MTSPKRSPADSDQSALDWARDIGASARVIRDMEVLVQRGRRRQRMSLAAAALALLIVAVVVWRSPPPAGPVPPAALTALHNATLLRPETRRLPDGSTVELKSGAEITVDYAGPARRVTLAHGEALFQVAKDSTRPFIVMAGGVEVRAVGTAFSVQLDAKTVAVLVTEGRVSVDQPSNGNVAAPGSLVVAGRRWVVELQPAAVPEVLAVEPAEMNERLAWRVPRLDLNATPLNQVIPLFNEFCQPKLVLAEPLLGNVLVSGVLRADNTDSLLRLLEGEFRIKADHQPGRIVLHR